MPERDRAPSREPVSGAQTPAGFRLDIQGVRGFALVLVLLAHAEVPAAEGGFVGLDVFFVLSGFLITGLLLQEIAKTGTVSLLRFYARRARRLLPLAVTVLGVVALAALIAFPSVRAHETSGDVVAAALYVVNWRFMAEAVDYFAFDDPTVSPVQHYWSLSVEEQFYLVWPLVILTVLAVARRAGWDRRALLWLVLALGVGASLAWSVAFSHADPQQAYFSTATRAWELLAGCALALALPAGLRMPRALASVLAAGGLAVLTYTAVSFTNDTPWPGSGALAPVLATVAIIVAGTAVTPSAPIRLLSIAPLQYLGKISYAWYLWHWPAIVFATAAFGRLTVVELLGVTLLAWIPATISHHLVEERFRHSRTLARRPRRAVAVGLTCTAAAVAVGVAVGAVQPTLRTAAADEVEGAAATTVPQRRADAVRPNPLEAEGDRGRAFDDGCLVKGTRDRSPRCVYGDRSSETTVVLFGDSHALQYAPAVLRLAAERGWRVVVLVRASCPVADVDYQDTCNAWRERTMRRIERERPDLTIVSNGTDDRFRVVVDGDRISRRASQPLLEAGFARTLRRLKAAGSKVAVIRDQTRAPFDVAECVGDHLDDLDACSFPADRSWAHAFDARGARRVRGVRVLDPLPLACPKRRCRAVIGDALVYRDTFHFSATFARTMAPWLTRGLPRV